MNINLNKLYKYNMIVSICIHLWKKNQYFIQEYFSLTQPNLFFFPDVRFIFPVYFL